MDNRLEYKGYYAKVEIDFEAQEFYGELDGITDYVDFISDMKDGMPGIVREFHSAVDDYLEFCKEIGKTPARPEQKLELMRA